MRRLQLLIEKIGYEIKKIANDESGMGVVEIVLIILVLVGLAVIFKTNITSIVRSLLSSIRTQTNGF